MSPAESPALKRFRASLRREYHDRFPGTSRYLRGDGRFVLDGTSHAVRWNEPFMPAVRSARGAWIEDLDGHRMVDYWQGHFANVLGHNPSVVRDALAAALAEGRGLQTGMVHELEGEVSALIARCTGCETVRLTTSGSLGTFYAMLLARAYTGRSRVLKVAGGWHGSQPFGLKGVSAHGTSFEHLESEGLSAGLGEEIVLTRFNDAEDLREAFRAHGDRIACFVVEPVLGAGGGMVATTAYLREARRLTEKHGALLLCDEIITGFRFRAGDVCTLYGVRPDLSILGKTIGGGMPVAAVAGRADVMALCSRENGRVKFEGGTYSSHELSLVAARTMMRHLIDHEGEIFPQLAESGRRLRERLQRVADQAGLPIFVFGQPEGVLPGSSLIFVYAATAGASVPTCPEELAENRHPLIDERLLKATLLLQDVSARHGLGAVSTRHGEEEFRRTLEGYSAAIERFRAAGLI
jgi:glutamate-1-semialdehyde 2,1-aminomutase